MPDTKNIYMVKIQEILTEAYDSLFHSLFQLHEHHHTIYNPILKFFVAYLVHIFGNGILDFLDLLGLQD